MHRSVNLDSKVGLTQQVDNDPSPLFEDGLFGDLKSMSILGLNIQFPSQLGYFLFGNMLLHQLSFEDHEDEILGSKKFFGDFKSNFATL